MVGNELISFGCYACILLVGAIQFETKKNLKKLMIRMMMVVVEGKEGANDGAEYCLFVCVCI